MKKLMVAVAIVCAAVCAQAANIDWSLTGKNALKSKGGTTWGNSTVYLVLADSEDAIIAALEGGATSFTKNDAGIVEVGTTGSTALITTTTASSDKLVGRGDGGSKYAFELLQIDTTSVAGETWYRFSASQEEYAYTPGKDDATSLSFAGATFNTVEWTQAVPEPTSGLLLLLGVAGLALRRRRA